LAFGRGNGWLIATSQQESAKGNPRNQTLTAPTLFLSHSFHSIYLNKESQLIKPLSVSLK
jgi:hypothetical protein